MATADVVAYGPGARPASSGVGSADLAALIRQALDKKNREQGQTAPSGTYSDADLLSLAAMASDAAPPGGGGAGSPSLGGFPVTGGASPFSGASLGVAPLSLPPSIAGAGTPNPLFNSSAPEFADPAATNPLRDIWGGARQWWSMMHGGLPGSILRPESGPGPGSGMADLTAGIGVATSLADTSAPLWARLVRAANQLPLDRIPGLGTAIPGTSMPISSPGNYAGSEVMSTGEVGGGATQGLTWAALAKALIDSGVNAAEVSKSPEEGVVRAVASLPFNFASAMSYGALPGDLGSRFGDAVAKGFGTIQSSHGERERGEMGVVHGMASNFAKELSLASTPEELRQTLLRYGDGSAGLTVHPYNPEGYGGVLANPDSYTASIQAGVRPDFLAPLDRALTEAVRANAGLFKFAEAGNPDAQRLLAERAVAREQFLQEGIRLSPTSPWPQGAGQYIGEGQSFMDAMAPNGLYQARNLGELMDQTLRSGRVGAVGWQPAFEHWGTMRRIAGPDNPDYWTANLMPSAPRLATWAMQHLGIGPEERRERGWASFHREFEKRYPLTGESQFRRYHRLARQIIEVLEKQPPPAQQMAAQRIYQRIVAPLGETLEPHEIDEAWTAMRGTALALTRQLGMKVDPADIPKPEHELEARTRQKRAAERKAQRERETERDGGTPSLGAAPGKEQAA